VCCSGKTCKVVKICHSPYASFVAAAAHGNDLQQATAGCLRWSLDYYFWELFSPLVAFGQPASLQLISWIPYACGPQGHGINTL
jgi:hypothetical protein